jgi:hypothetical protein
MDAELRDLLRHSLRSVWNIEILLALFRSPNRAWNAEDLVRELRASDFIVSQGTQALQQAGLAAGDAQGQFRYAPASTDLDRMVQELERIYRERPSVVTKALFAPVEENTLQTFADAFRVKKD